MSLEASEVGKEMRCAAQKFVATKLRALYDQRSAVISAGQIVEIMDDARLELKISNLSAFPDALRDMHFLAVEFPNETFDLPSLLSEVNRAAV